MAEDGLEPVDVTGRWMGFYRYRAEALGNFPIVAELVQRGSRVSGEMYDQITDRSDTLEQLLETRGPDMCLTKRLRLQGIVDRLGTASITVATTLPDTSDIVGKIHGDEVRFTKTYRGATLYSSTVAGYERATTTVERVVDGHSVDYAGLLDRELRVISGRWIIWKKRLISRIFRLKEWGTFELYMKT
jgi:hypothetical protein